MDEFDEDAILRQIGGLRQQHRDLDAALSAFIETGTGDQLRITRLKKQKLALKDRINALEDQLHPDIIA